MIIGIAGKFCSGKSSICELLKKQYGDETIILNFADKVKSIAEDLFNMTEKDRSLLQLLGMKMREIRDSVWIDYVLRQYDGTKVIIIGDVRFENEVDAINAEGGKVYYIDRDRDQRLIDYFKLYGKIPTLEQESHPSELLRPDVCDKIIKNISLEQVIQEITDDGK